MQTAVPVVVLTQEAPLVRYFHAWGFRRPAGRYLIRQSPLSWSLDDGQLNDWNGGRGVYFKDPNGHVLELMTVPQ